MNITLEDLIAIFDKLEVDRSIPESVKNGLYRAIKYLKGELKDMPEDPEIILNSIGYKR